MAAFTRDFDIVSENISLKFEQYSEGDVSCVVWDAALVLAGYLDCENKRNKNFLRGKTVIELGSGIGCVAVTAACLGAHVTATDLPSVIPMLEKSIELNEVQLRGNNGSIRALPLDWEKRESTLASPDVILMADCIYYENSIRPLIETMVNLSDSHTQVFIAQELRDSEKQQEYLTQFKHLLQENFNVQQVNRADQHPSFQSSDIVLLRATKKNFI